MSRRSATELQNRLQPQITKLDASIKFEISAINGTDWNDFLAKVLTQIAAGTPPDIISVATEGLQLMASKELADPARRLRHQGPGRAEGATSPTSTRR